MTAPVFAISVTLPNLGALQVFELRRSIVMRIALFSTAAAFAICASATLADVPKSLRGTWDVSQAACARGASATRVTVTRNRLDLRGGFADVTQTELSQNSRRFVAFVRGAFYAEGASAPAVQTEFWRLEHLGSRNTMGIKRKNRTRQDLVRCGAVVASARLPATAAPAAVEAAGTCGHYVVLAEKRDLEGAFALQDRLGITKVAVIDSDQLKAFRNGRHLVLTGPFTSQAGARAEQSKWSTRVPGAYVKRSC